MKNLFIFFVKYLKIKNLSDTSIKLKRAHPSRLEEEEPL